MSDISTRSSDLSGLVSHLSTTTQALASQRVALGEAIQRQLLPARALVALKSFRDLIEDGRAMLAGEFVERVRATAETQLEAGGSAELRTPVPTRSGDDTDFDPGNFSFDFAAGDAAEADSMR